MRFHTRLGRDQRFGTARSGWGRRRMRYPASEKLEIITARPIAGFDPAWLVST
jgi:hypothetical protein